MKATTNENPSLELLMMTNVINFNNYYYTILIVSAIFCTMHVLFMYFMYLNLTFPYM